PIHPFFTAASTQGVKPRATAPRVKTAKSLPTSKKSSSAATEETRTSAPSLKTAKSLPAAKKSSLVRISPKTAEPTPVLPTPVELTIVPDPPEDLPIYSYKSLSPAPKMHFTRDEADADRWVQRLDQSRVISVDFEWVVVYRKGGIRPISLVQIADAKTIIVIQLRTSNSAMGRFPLLLQRLFEDPDVPKTGANILGDAKKLFKDYGVMMAGLVELGALARVADPSCTDAWGKGKRIVSLAKVVERYLHKELPKDMTVRVSNWEDPSLEEKKVQIEYAANDAYSALQVYNRLLSLAKANEITLDPIQTATRVHHAALVPPPSTSTPTPVPAPSTSTSAPTDPSTLPPVPMIVLTPAMEAAGVASQHLRAYRHWALGARDIDTMCAELAVRPRGASVDFVPAALARGTVVTYVVSAVKQWPALAYDLGKLRLLIQTDLKSWQRHYEWVASVAAVDAPV
ncbi:ribonuclease H-like protein, partial [Mycena polygramma]